MDAEIIYAHTAGNKIGETDMRVKQQRVINGYRNLSQECNVWQHTKSNGIHYINGMKERKDT